MFQIVDQKVETKSYPDIPEQHLACFGAFAQQGGVLESPECLSTSTAGNLPKCGERLDCSVDPQEIYHLDDWS